MVVCATNASNFIRRYEFIKAMKSVGASYVMLNHADHLGSGNFDPTLTHALACLLSERSYELIVTHGKNGEYGHPQHRACQGGLPDSAFGTGSVSSRRSWWSPPRDERR